MNDITLVSKEYTESIFVTGPELDSKLSPLASKEYVSGFISGPLSLKQDKLTAGANIKIENNVISATGGGSSNENELQPGDQVIWDIIPAAEPLQTILPNPYPVDFEMNINCSFPVTGRMEITHIIVPRLKIDKSGYYIGYSNKTTSGAYKENHKLSDFWAVTSKPCNIENDGESTYIYNIECKMRNMIGGIGGFFAPEAGWTGWLNSGKPSIFTKIAYYSKTTNENGEEVYVYEADLPTQPFPIYAADKTKIWSNNPNFDPSAEQLTNGMTVMLRSMKLGLDPTAVAYGLRYVFHPDLSWPKDHPVATKPAES